MLNRSRRSRLSQLLTFALSMGVAACAGPKSAAEAVCDQGSICRDSDCDTICDADEGFPDRDSDGDGTPDYLDEDSDGDGFDDRMEAGDTDPKTAPFDRNGNGVADYLETGYPRPRQADASAGERDAAMDPKPVNPESDASMPESDASVSPDATLPSTCDAPLEDDCIAEEKDSCDAVDNDCDGRVDEGAFCPCGARGQVRACFRGSPARRHVGACSDGTQVCGGGEFGAWGPCTGGSPASVEQCDDIDNDCNGCVDDIAECKPVLSCPMPNDPRVPAAQPFSPYSLDARDFYSGQDATGYTWRIAGSPCDTLFRTLDSQATQASGKLSYRIVGPSLATPTMHFALSGSYPVELTIHTERGPQVCNFQIPVRAPGLRVELCWDQTGPVAAAAGRRVDLDLHLAKQGLTQAWDDDNDCFWDTCKGLSSPFGYPTTPLDHCRGSQNTAVYENPLVDACPNPRLDADNRLDGSSATAYITENINLDVPRSGDRYRVMVHYNDNTPSDRGTPTPIAVHPLVNIYCGGELLATFGGDPAQVGSADLEEVQGFTDPGQRWLVTDVQVDQGGEAARCSLSSLIQNGDYWISTDAAAF